MKTLFLRWMILQTLAVALLVALVMAGFADGLHGAPAYVAVVILIVALAASSYAGLLCLRVESSAWTEHSLTAEAVRVARRTRLVHEAEHVGYSVAVLQLLGLVGAIMGYREETKAAELPNAADAIHNLTLGLGNGLTATLLGVLCSLVVWAEYHLLTHALEHP